MNKKNLAKLAILGLLVASNEITASNFPVTQYENEPYLAANGYRDRYLCASVMDNPRYNQGRSGYTQPQSSYSGSATAYNDTQTVHYGNREAWRSRPTYNDQTYSTEPVSYNPPLREPGKEQIRRELERNTPNIPQNRDPIREQARNMPRYSNNWAENETVSNPSSMDPETRRRIIEELQRTGRDLPRYSNNWADNETAHESVQTVPMRQYPSNYPYNSYNYPKTTGSSYQ